MNVLITGFDPFGGEPVNPAWEAVKQLEGLTIAVEIAVTEPEDAKVTGGTIC